YLQAVAAFEASLNGAVPSDLEESEQQVQQFLQSAAEPLAALRSQSVDMVNENPFQLANKSGTLEKIKNRMRDRLDLESSKDSFRTFWSAEYLGQAGIQSELTWFNQQIVPLVATNYFRPIGESGRFVDRFWMIDIWFIGLFAADILVRALVICRRRPGMTLTDALLWRWYDWVLLIPIWRILRILPVTLRCHQVGWIDLGQVEKQVTGYLAENLLDDLSEMILVRAFNIAQSTVRDGNLNKWLATQAQAVEINDVNEIQVIAERLATVLVMQIIPSVQPELEAILRHSVEQGLTQLPVYKELQFLPGINFLPRQVTRELVHQVTELTGQTLEDTLKDEKGQVLAAKLAEKVVQSVQTELQDPKLLADLQLLLGDLLEEWKLTLVQSFESQNVEQTAAEIAQIRQNQQQDLGKAPAEQQLGTQQAVVSDTTKMR
ncbi:MAG: hypothetical protein AAGB01_01100, partial [Cyanobacteria bacterium P01_F01_bin.42]